MSVDAELIQPVSDFPFNGQQRCAIDKAVRWYRRLQDATSVGRKYSVKQFFFLSGFAGTGKTTVAREISTLCADPTRVVYIAPTGKAASRLRQKGCINAMTMHQFLYNMVGEYEDESPMFVAKGALKEDPLIIVLDECLMVGVRDMMNLLAHGIPVLSLGDLGQLPPVRGELFFNDENVDFELTDIERNDGNIVRASMFVRNGGRLPPRIYDDVKVYDGRPPSKITNQHLDEDSVILCSYNSTRRKYNHLARAALGYTLPMPQIGEKLVCMFNQHNYGFMNGEQCILLKLDQVEHADMTPEEFDTCELGDIFLATVRSLTDLTEKKVRINMKSFSYDEETRDHFQKKVGGFDFGYALTVHKSQGSEWKRVMVIEEWLRSVPYAKSMYTAITRAIEHLTIFRADVL